MANIPEIAALNNRKTLDVGRVTQPQKPVIPAAATSIKNAVANNTAKTGNARADYAKSASAIHRGERSSAQSTRAAHAKNAGNGAIPQKEGDNAWMAPVTQIGKAIGEIGKGVVAAPGAIAENKAQTQRNAAMAKADATGFVTPINPDFPVRNKTSDTPIKDAAPKADNVVNTVQQLQRVVPGGYQGVFKTIMSSAMVKEGIDQRYNNPIAEAKTAGIWNSPVEQLSQTPITNSVKIINSTIQNAADFIIPAPQSAGAQLVAQAADSVGEAGVGLGLTALTGGLSPMAALTGNTLSHLTGGLNAAGTEMVEGSGDPIRSIVAGVVEAETEKLGGKLFDPISGKMTNKALSAGFGMIGEGLEEIISGAAQAGVFGDYYSPQQAIDDGIVGILAGGMTYGGVGGISNAISSMETSIPVSDMNQGYIDQTNHYKADQIEAKQIQGIGKNIDNYQAPAGSDVYEKYNVIVDFAPQTGIERVDVKSASNFVDGNTSTDKSIIRFEDRSNSFYSPFDSIERNNIIREVKGDFGNELFAPASPQDNSASMPKFVSTLSNMAAGAAVTAGLAAGVLSFNPSVAAIPTAVSQSQVQQIDSTKDTAQTSDNAFEMLVEVPKQSSQSSNVVSKSDSQSIDTINDAKVIPFAETGSSTSPMAVDNSVSSNVVEIAGNQAAPQTSSNQSTSTSSDVSENEKVNSQTSEGTKQVVQQRPLNVNTASAQPVKDASQTEQTNKHEDISVSTTQQDAVNPAAENVRENSNVSAVVEDASESNENEHQETTNSHQDAIVNTQAAETTQTTRSNSTTSSQAAANRASSIWSPTAAMQEAAQAQTQVQFNRRRGVSSTDGPNPNLASGATGQVYETSAYNRTFVGLSSY